MIHELSYGIQRLADGRRKERFRSYLQNLLSSGLPVLPYDNAAALWHGEQRASLRPVDCGLPLLMDRSPRLLQLRAWCW